MSYESLTTNNINALPNESVCLLLGTSKQLSNGKENQFYSNRINAAQLAYSSGKCSKFVVSGDNRKHNYNEPEMMKESLSKLGIPENIIHCDFAGGRTLDSVIRFNKIFGQSTGIVISQKFHNARAIYIAKNNGMNMIGFNADDPKAFGGLRTKIREVFSRIRAFLDVQAFHSEPRHYGKEISI